MNDFQLYKKQLIEDSKVQERQNSIKKMIVSYRKNFSLDNAAIFPLLKESYGSSFTDKQLRSLLNATK